MNRIVVILGAGGLGLYAAAIAREAGAVVVAVDDVDSRLALAADFGAHHTLKRSDYGSLDDQIQAMQEVLAGRVPDVVVDVTGAPAAIADAVQICGEGGTILELGAVSLDSRASATIVPGFITRKCLTIKGVLRYQPWYLHRGLALLARIQDVYPFAKLSEREFTLEETEQAILAAAQRTAGRPIIRPGASDA